MKSEARLRSLPSWLIVGHALGVASEAFEELSNAAAGANIEDTLLLQKEGNNDLDQMHSYYFIYFVIMGNNSDNFVLNKYIVRSSLYIENIYNKFVVHSLFFKSVLSIYKVEYNSETVDNVHESIGYDLFYKHKNPIQNGWQLSHTSSSKLTQPGSVLPVGWKGRRP